MNNKEIFEPAFPTTPIQNQFGQVVMFMGLSKIELITAIISSNSDDKTIDECITIAESIITKCYEKAKQSNNTSGSIIAE